MLRSCSVTMKTILTPNERMCQVGNYVLCVSYIVEVSLSEGKSIIMLS